MGARKMTTISSTSNFHKQWTFIRYLQITTLNKYQKKHVTCAMKYEGQLN